MGQMTTHWRRRISSAAWVLCAHGFSVDAGAQLPASVDPQDAWFKPVLELDEDAELCASVLDTAVREFFLMSPRPFSPARWSPLLEAFQPRSNRLSTTTAAGYIDPDAAEPIPFAEIDGRAVYVATTAHGGCGGTCDSKGFHASLRPIVVASRNDRDAYARAGALSLFVPDYSYQWLRTSDGRYYVAHPDTYRGDIWSLVSLTNEASWRPTCRVRNRPERLEDVEDARLRAALASILALDAAAEEIAGRGGDCGTLHALDRVNIDRRRLLEEALYRPWGLPPRGVPPRGDDLPPQIEQWAAMGLAERNAVAKYRAQRAATLTVLAEFYAAQFRWSAAEARAVAHAALASAADNAFVFPERSPAYDDRGSAPALRRALVEHRPLDEIRRIQTTVVSIDGKDDSVGESLLNAAVTYPEALAYLLDLGGNPNQPNAFGKTPLMYAAQYDAYDSAKLLLDRGADPNAMTVPPWDTCYYSLRTTSVTALHYAVRYASADLVTLLVDRGAAVFIGVQESVYPPRGALAVDWLRRYTSADAIERNPNIGADDVGALAARLAVPDADGLDAFAVEFAIRAEAAYASGDVEAAYSALRLALKASPTHPRALSDMSLVALRAGHPDEAAAAAFTLAQSGSDRRTVANAWFNYGLACEIPERRRRYGACPLSIVLPFLRSWNAEPTAARADKIRSVMESAATCVETRPDGTVYRYLIPYVQNQREGRLPQRIYVAHSAAADMRGRQLAWRPLDAPTATVSFVARHELGDFVVSELESQQALDYPEASPDFSCVAAPR